MTGYGPDDASNRASAPASHRQPRVTSSGGIIEHVSHYQPRHAKPVPFTDTTLGKTLVLTAVTAAGAGIATTGGAAATYHLGAHPAVDAHYGVPAYDHADPDHNEPAGEFVYIEPAPTIGTASVNHVVLGPGD